MIEKTKLECVVTSSPRHLLAKNWPFLAVLVTFSGDGGDGGEKCPSP